MRWLSFADLITSLDWEARSSSVEIFMGLEEGNVAWLTANSTFTLRLGLSEHCLQQMPSARNLLACKGIVRRDVTLENVLWNHSMNQ